MSNNKLKLTEEDMDMFRILGIYTTTSTTSTVGVSMLFHDTNEKLKNINKSLNTYVESMSDEELETTLEKLDMLPSSEETINKTK